jgi:hypothetical protein
MMKMLRKGLDIGDEAKVKFSFKLSIVRSSHTCMAFQVEEESEDEDTPEDDKEDADKDSDKKESKEEL